MLGLGTLSRKIFGTANDRKVKAVLPLVEKINALEPEFQAMDDAALIARTEALKARFDAALLPEALAQDADSLPDLPDPFPVWRRTPAAA